MPEKFTMSSTADPLELRFTGRQGSISRDTIVLLSIQVALHL
jgi:hypothetical protein